MLKRKIALLAAVMLAGVGWLALVRPWEAPQPRHARIGADQDGLYLDIDLGDMPFDYVCLTSAEYDQLYLAESWRCGDCRMSDETRDLISNVRAPFLPLLMIKHDREIRVEYVDIPQEWIYDPDNFLEKPTSKT